MTLADARGVGSKTWKFLNAAKFYEVPTLIIWGDRDNIIPVSHAYAAHDAILGSRLEIIQGTGHFPHVEEPLRFVEILSEFIDSTEPSSVTAEQRRELLLTHDPPAP